MPTPEPRTYTLRIALDEIEPEIWRSVAVPSDITLEQLHRVAQVAMGWLNGHLHEFRKGMTRFGVADEDWPDAQLVDENDVRLSSVLTRRGQKLEYVYDFGDNWAHTITLTGNAKERCAVPVCLDGAGRCPPEDCGGPWQYMEMVRVLTVPSEDKDDEDLREMAEMVFHNGWDAEDFDRDAVNAVLSRGVDALPGNLFDDDVGVGFENEDGGPIPFPGAGPA